MRPEKYKIKDIVRWLWRNSRGNRLQAFLNASLGLLDVVVSLVSVWTVQRAIDIAAHSREGSLYWAVAYMGIMVLCSFAINICGVWIKNILGIKAQNRMQQRILDHILRSEWQGRGQRHSGDIINRLETDVSDVVTFITETIPGTISVLAMFFGSFFYLFSMDKVLAMTVVVMLPIFILASKIYIRHMRRLTRLVRDSDSKVQSVLQETIQNKMLVKTLELDDEMVERLEETQSELRQNVIRRTKFRLGSNFILNFGFSFTYLVAFLWSALRMSNHTLSFGGMTAFLQLVNKIQRPARELTKLAPTFVSVLTASERLMELEENPLEEQGKPIDMDAEGGVGVRMDCITYNYGKKEKKITENFSFDFKPGSCTAILGETGAGKTTLARLLLALIKPQSGNIYIYNVRESRRVSPRTRCNFVYVPQGNTLLSGTIRDNLRLGRIDATEEDMKRALRDACADFVLSLPKGLDTKCAEAGGGLSEGQAQRIAIARALLRQGSIMLFDEATSALDPETERQLLSNLLTKHNKTVIFITHRLAVTEYCDQTLRLNPVKNV